MRETLLSEETPRAKARTTTLDGINRAKAMMVAKAHAQNLLKLDSKEESDNEEKEEIPTPEEENSLQDLENGEIQTIKLSQKQASKESADSKDILKEAAKLKYLEATYFSLERVTSLTAFLASRKLTFLLSESLESLWGLLMNWESKDLIEIIILTISLESDFEQRSEEMQEQIACWLNGGWSQGEHVMTIEQMHAFMIDHVKRRLTDEANEKSHPAQRAGAKAQFATNMKKLIKDAAAGAFNSMATATAVKDTLKPFLTEAFRKDSWDHEEESKSLAKEIVIEFKLDAKKSQSQLKPFSEFLDERERELQRGVTCLRDLQSAMLEFLMKIRTMLSFIASLTKTSTDFGKKPDGVKKLDSGKSGKKPDGGIQPTKTYREALGKKSSDSIPACKTCGENGDNSHHALPKGCPFEHHKHPERNKSHPTWEKSNAQNAAKAAGHDKLPYRKLLDGTVFEMGSAKKTIPNGKRSNSDMTESKSEENVLHEFLHMLGGLDEKSIRNPKLTTSPNPFLSTNIRNLRNRRGQEVQRNVDSVLVDTGAITDNYVSRTLASCLEKHYGIVRIADYREVKTPNRKAPKFITEGRIDLTIELFNEITQTIEEIKLSALIIDSPIDLIVGLPTIREHGLLTKCANQILWGTREKWINDPTVTPAVFKAADVNMLNSMVDELMEKYNNPEESEGTHMGSDNNTTINPITTEKGNFHNCAGCYTLVSHEDSKQHAETRVLHGEGAPSGPAISCHRVEPSQKKTLNLCLLCTDAEIRYIVRLRQESKEFFSTMETSEVLDDTRQMLYQLKAKVDATIADAQQQEHFVAKAQQLSANNKKRKATDNSSDANNCTGNPQINLWDGLCSALSSDTLSPKKGKPPPPTVKALQGVKPGEIIPKSKLLDEEDPGTGEPFNWINDPENDPVYASKEWIEKSEEWTQCRIDGSPELQHKIRTLLQKYKNVFSSKLPTQPARVQPLAFQIDETKWKLPCNREPPRRQSLTKDEVIRNMISEMIQSGVTSTSKADAWSQVLLTAKPNGKWRFCIDYRRLNELIENRGWPLPRIGELITRVGNAKPKVFGKLDLTNGYHQMPLAKESRKYTAFRSSNGLYESNRVPMGLKNAAAYFQQAMADEVLGDSLYDGNELYLDDVLIHATNDDEFIRRLETILIRCQNKGIVLSPSKCAFGMAEMEILGHTLNSKGSTFSREKLQGVLDFKLPTTSTQLQSFLGLSNYFRDHVRNVADLESPLRDLLKTSKGKHSQLTWSESDKAAFQKLKEAVWNCPRLYFWQSHLPVFLHTDACNTGIGAYLFQIDEDGKELPIGFLSRALKGAELNWSTFEQEGFAIHQALKKFEYLLRDIKFTLRTDHRNLLYMNMKASDKVLRWKLDVQQFDFDVEHIPGPENVVADLYSRLCTLQTMDDNGDIDGNIDEEELEELLTSMKESEQRPSGFLAAMHNRFKPAPATRVERPMDETVHNWLKKCHGHDSLHGHRGVEATLSLLKAIVPPAEYWPRMRQDTRDFVRQCPCCQFMQSSKTLIATTAPFNVSVRGPMDRLNIDSIGPLPPDENGNTYIIVVCDVFSRFIELYPAPDATAFSAAKAVIQWIGRYGIPGEILTDNGTQYTADIISQLCNLLRVEHLTILPYSHEENAIVERANREVNKHLRAIVFDKKVKTEWSLFLPLVQRIMNASVKVSTGVTPASIIFGNSVDLDKGLLPDAEKRANEHVEGKPLNEYLSRLLSAQAHVIALAQETQFLINQEHIRRKTDSGNQVTGYDINDYVIYEYPQSLLVGDSRPDKLAMHYRGPYRIVAINGSRIDIQNLVNTQTTTAHISQLRPFLYDPNYINPVEVAKNAGEEFEIDNIVTIRGKRGSNGKYLKTGLEIKVHWLGYAEQHDTWEPFHEMKLTEKFQQYCWDNNHHYLLIPEALERLKGNTPSLE